MRIRRFSNWFFALLWVVVTGCGTQQFGPQGRELFGPLQTAISARNLEWVDATEKRVEEQVEEGTLSDFELNALSSIIEDCRAGDWKQAQSALQVFADGQRATAEDLVQLREGESRTPAAERRKRAKKNKS